MKIPDEIFEEILRSNDIVDVISSYLQLKRRGKTFIGLCPFHPDKNPSLNVSQDKQLYHCFSCKAGGNVITFVQEYEKITPMEAVERLAQRVGITLGKYSSRPDISNEISKLYDINQRAAKYFHENLMGIGEQEKEMVWDYLDKRGLDRSIITKFGIGYARNNWHALENFFIEEGTYSNSDLELAGLVIRSEKDFKYHDRFRGRLIFPIFNESGKVVGFGGRVLKGDDDSAKYINSPETRIYNKSKTLYGLNFAKDSIRSNDSVILVEGYMDVVSLYQSEIMNVVASSGTALTEEQISLISRYTKNVYLIYDSDLAGIKAAKRGIELILEKGLNIKVVSLPDGEDPDSFVKTHGKSVFMRELEKSNTIVSFISSIYEREGKLSTPEEKADFVKEIIQYIVRMPERIKGMFYIKELAEKYKLYESDMRDEYNRAAKQYKKSQFPRSSVVLPERKVYGKRDREIKPPQAEIELVNMFVNSDYKNHSYKKGVNYLVDNVYIDYISNKTILKTVELLLDEWHNEEKIDVARLLSKIEDEEIKSLLISQTTQKYEITTTEHLPADSILSIVERTPIDYMKMAKDIIDMLKLHNINRKIRESIKKSSSPEENRELLEEKKKAIRKSEKANSQEKGKPEKPK